ncbi:alpha beta hydrolase fold protein [Phlyctema vagabunda]|uniref:Alpha beta hydrolase fold protein n=1 Tax=Phlyctema vagabunda TaxID=108571 RepID=A0ABR4PCY7_9HELO
MIVAYGGARFIRELLTRWAGKNEVGNKRFAEQDAVGVYADFFENEKVVRATCDDYRAGAEEDIELEKKDQDEGRKLESPTLLIYAADVIGKRWDMMKVWGEWVSEKDLLKEVGIGEGIGHFVPEEAPEKTAEAIQNFYSKIAAK